MKIIKEPFFNRKLIFSIYLLVVLGIIINSNYGKFQIFQFGILIGISWILILLLFFNFYKIIGDILFTEQNIQFKILEKQEAVNYSEIISMAIDIKDFTIRPNRIKNNIKIITPNQTFSYSFFIKNETDLLNLKSELNYIIKKEIIIISFSKTIQKKYRFLFNQYKIKDI